MQSARTCEKPAESSSTLSSFRPRIRPLQAPGEGGFRAGTNGNAAEPQQQSRDWQAGWARGRAELTKGRGRGRAGACRAAGCPSPTGAVPVKVTASYLASFSTVERLSARCNECLFPMEVTSENSVGKAGCPWSQII